MRPSLSLRLLPLGMPDSSDPLSNFYRGEPFNVWDNARALSKLSSAGRRGDFLDRFLLHTAYIFGYAHVAQCAENVGHLAVLKTFLT